MSGGGAAQGGRGAADVMEAVERIRLDREHGASALAREAAQAMADVASQAGSSSDVLARAQVLGRALALARPSMAAIANTVTHLWGVASSGEGDAEAQLKALRAEALALEAHWGAAIDGMVHWARAEVTGVVYTLSRSGTVEQTLTRLAHERSVEDPLRVIVSESRPGGEGVALARALAAAGARVTLAADSACATFMGEAALVIVGADSVRGDGSVVNKVGTHALALVAHAFGTPVYALAERLKITPDSYPLVIEEMPPDELLPEMVEGVTARNIYFDVTPSALITGVILETGAVGAGTIARLAQEAERDYESLMHP
ncbi:MAG TPA: hypothetical protein VE338_10140 [Ktedonobacterales bacterium]|jgi:translation initiation factor 2B subunit (eIF-2B alpha/beta/delta family)|nr:hypothetical protein [Ktedonobacterales bacterium]